MWVPARLATSSPRITVTVAGTLPRAELKRVAVTVDS